MSNSELSYPVLAFGRGLTYPPWENHESFAIFPDEKSFAAHDRNDFERRTHMGLFLLDTSGDCWEVVDVRRVKSPPTLASRILEMLGRGPAYAIDHELRRASPISFEDAKARVCIAIENHADFWRHDEMVAGEAGPPREEREMLEELKAAVLTAETIEGLDRLLDEVSERQESVDTEELLRVASPSGAFEAVVSAEPHHRFVAALSEVRIVEAGKRAVGPPVFAAFRVEDLRVEWRAEQELLIRAAASGEPRDRASIKIGGTTIAVERQVDRVGPS